MKITLLIVLSFFLPVLLFATELGPQPMRKFQPRYPFEAFQEGVSGRAMVEFSIHPDGSISDVIVVEATREDFGEAASVCIRKWEFAPTRLSAAIRRQTLFVFEHPKNKKGANQAPR